MNKLTTKKQNRRDKVLKKMNEYDSTLYKEIIQYLQDDNYYNPL